MKRRIVGYRQDEDRHWVAVLACGHGQHVRHDPPWINRPWVTTLAGRQSKLGESLECVLCEQEPPSLET
jgi:hypothetical protein